MATGGKRPGGATLSAFRVVVTLMTVPRVARSSQPWALGRNPFGILLAGVQLVFETNWSILDSFPTFCYSMRVRREVLKDITRIVVKLGTGVLTDSRKQPDYQQMERLVR